MKQNNVIRMLFNVFLVVILYVICYFLVKNTKVSTFSIFETTGVFTYFGVLIGFAITIYTFGLSMISNLKAGIDNSKTLSDLEKKENYELIINGFKEIKEDIWAIFFALITVVICAICKDIINPFGWEVESWKVPETTNLTLFFYSTLCMYDIIKALFNISEINMTLLK